MAGVNVSALARRKPATSQPPRTLLTCFADLGGWDGMGWDGWSGCMDLLHRDRVLQKLLADRWAVSWARIPMLLEQHEYVAMGALGRRRWVVRHNRVCPGSGRAAQPMSHLSYSTKNDDPRCACRGQDACLSISHASPRHPSRSNAATGPGPRAWTDRRWGPVRPGQASAVCTGPAQRPTSRPGHARCR
jgi:hypothetical protein